MISPLPFNIPQISQLQFLFPVPPKTENEKRLLCEKCALKQTPNAVEH